MGNILLLLTLGKGIRDVANPKRPRKYVVWRGKKKRKFNFYLGECYSTVSRLNGIIPKRYIRGIILSDQSMS